MSNNTPDLILSSKDYFDELLESVLKESDDFKVHPFSKIYLSDLLINFIHVDSLFHKTEDGRLESKMLSEQFFETQNYDVSTRIQKLKKLAETTLYVSGFFASSLNRKLVNQSYYIQIGSMVYANLSTVVEPEPKSNLYLHLAKHFLGYVDVLTEISQKTNIQKSDDVLEMFGRYMDSGSQWAEKLLIKNGVPLIPLKKTSN